MGGRAGKQALTDGFSGPERLGNQGEVITGAMNGFFYEQILRGNGYVWNTALAGNALVAATTSNAPALCNPPASGRMLVLQKITYVRTAVGTPLEGGIVYCKTKTNSIIGTGADIVSGTLVAGGNLRFDGADNSGMLFFPTTIVTTPTPTFFVESGISQAASTGTTTGVMSLNLIDYINGLIVVPPGWMFSIAASVSLSTTYAISIMGLSLPAPVISN